MRETMKRVVAITVISLLVVAVFVPAVVAPPPTIVVMCEEGIKDETGDWLLGDGSETSDLVQLIDVGPDGVINPPDEIGNTTGDDSLICDIRIGEGYGPPDWNKGKFSHGLSLESGTVIYCRAWNAASPSTATYYGNSSTKTVTGAGDYEFGTWSTNTKKPSLIPPNITSFAPPTPVSNKEGDTRTFNININQTVNVTWRINGSSVHTNTSITEASYTNTSAVIGYWNVSAIANNVNGSDIQTWWWTVIEDCDKYDGCYDYGNGCEDRDYYWNGTSCAYNYSNRHTDYYDNWVNYCKGDGVWKHKLYHDFYCEAGNCTDHTSWVNDSLMDNCNDHDGWVDTGDTNWVDDPANECKEKEQKEQEYWDYTCSEGACVYSVTGTQWVDVGAVRNKPDGTDCGADYYDDWVNYCNGDEVWKHRTLHDFYCEAGSCTEHMSWEDNQLVENCNDYDGWMDTENMRWITDPANECREKEQKEQEYWDYTCLDGACVYSVTGTQWVDTGAVRYKPDGTICGCTANNTLKKCYAGSCSDTGICNSTYCGADAACDGKEPGEVCGIGSKCNSNCKCVKIITLFDTGAPANPYPSIFGTHNGTIKPNKTITVHKLYTYPCSGTGGHTESVRIWNSTLNVNVTATWEGYKEDWHSITFNTSFIMVANETYNYTLRTGSYPQIHHTNNLSTPAGFITCTEFIDANGKKYNDWIPAIRLY